MIYIASPYSSPIPELVEQRVQQVMLFCDTRMAIGEVVFSSVAYCHPIAKRLGLPSDANYWLPFNITMLRRADMAYFLLLPGWENSKGMAVERNVCKMLRIYTENYGPDFERCA